MKIIIITTIVILIIFIIQSITSISVARTETQKYTVLLKEKDFEIREYAPAILASVKMDKTTYRETSSGGFRILASYIFGQNEAQQKIAMTSPVHMKMEDNGTTMSFVMPSKYDLEDLPIPSSDAIEMHESPRVITASLKFGGYANDRVIREKMSELQRILKKKGIEHTGDFTFLGYNPPFQAINRRNEVLVSLVNYSGN